MLSACKIVESGLLEESQVRDESGTELASVSGIQLVSTSFVKLGDAVVVIALEGSAKDGMPE